MIVFGLGNPGSNYCHTRHNAGFDAVEKAAAFFQVSLKKRCFRLYRSARISEKNIIVEPLTYMNNSGKIVKYFKKYTSDPSKVAVVCDNMDLAAGGLRIRLGGGSSGQKGLDSIARALGSRDFVRIYVGVGRPQDNDVVSHVLGRETDPVKKEAYEKALEDASKAVVRFMEGASISELQCEFNRKGIL